MGNQKLQLHMCIIKYFLDLNRSDLSPRILLLPLWSSADSCPPVAKADSPFVNLQLQPIFSLTVFHSFHHIRRDLPPPYLFYRVLCARPPEDQTEIVQLKMKQTGKGLCHLAFCTRFLSHLLWVGVSLSWSLPTRL